MTSPETLYTKNVINELSFPLVTHTAYFDTRFGSYGFSKSGYSAGQIEQRSEILGLGPKMSESWRGLITYFASSLLSFSTPTHTHDFNNHSNGYGYFNDSARAELADCQKLSLQRSETQKQFRNLARIMIFKFVILLI
jgi:hypothetical protein